MNVLSFFAPRLDHPFYQDYRPYIALLRESCERFGHRHLVLTDDPNVGDDAYVVRGLPHNLMRAFLTVQHAYLADPQFANTPTLLTGADCVLAQDPSVFDDLIGDADILVTVGDFTDCRINMGAIYIPRPADVARIWADAIKRCAGEWGDDQRAFRDALAADPVVRVTEVSVDPYNLAPEHPGDDCRRGVVLHFRGPRKAWMTAYCHEWLGIGQGVQIKVAPNTDDETAIRQIKANLATSYAEIAVAPPQPMGAVIVGSGPSARDDAWKIRKLHEEGATIYALNGAVRWLESIGIHPHYGVMLDMREGNTRFVEGTAPTLAWLIASHCHPEVVKAARALPNTPMFFYHFGAEGVREHLPPGCMLVGGGPTVGLTAMVIATAMGYRNLELFGFDSSFREAETHLLQQPMNDEESKMLDVWLDGKRFLTNIGMYAQAAAFQEVVASLQSEVPDIRIAVHGQGLLPTMATMMAAQAALAETAAEAA